MNIHITLLFQIWKQYTLESNCGNFNLNNRIMLHFILYTAVVKMPVVKWLERSLQIW